MREKEGVRREGGFEEAFDGKAGVGGASGGGREDEVELRPRRRDMLDSDAFLCRKGRLVGSDMNEVRRCVSAIAS